MSRKSETSLIPQSPTSTMPGSITRSPDILPSATQLRDAYNIELHSADGHPVNFGELVLEKGEITTIVVFIRHFFCIYDQSYVRSVSGHITDSVLETLSHTQTRGPIQLIIIGCGDPSLIVPYVSETAAVMPVYTDPSGKLYEKLHMRRTVKGIMSQPVYSGVGFWRSLGITLKQMFWKGRRGILGGRWDQQGGEWIFKNGKVEYVHRMRDASDHLTAEELLGILESRGKGG
ncbi:peroxiredoxin-like family protein [Aspergillus stella-maris]|uniref:peroxiredoxin-like family protein n=1 Tax=Aspergillus stella-maris TaxID=1810926 RepID=UPI003CCD44AA